MNKRPRVITVIGWLFVGVGTVALIYHLKDFRTQNPFSKELIWVCLVRLMALLGGIFLLFDQNWARWLLGTWMAYHIILSAFHSLGKLLMHIVIFGIIGYFLFAPTASAWFRNRKKINSA